MIAQYSSVMRTKYQQSCKIPFNINLPAGKAYALPAVHVAGKEYVHSLLYMFALKDNCFEYPHCMTTAPEKPVSVQHLVLFYDEMLADHSRSQIYVAAMLQKITA